MRGYLRELRGSRRMPVPESPRVRDYGKIYLGRPHDVRLYPALLRERGAVQAEAVLEAGQSSCFFHPKLAATAICDASGRMICDLCKTEWAGQTVSFEALQSLIGKDGKLETARARILWDDVALALVFLPLLIWPFTIVTAPAALIICLVKFWKGPTGVLRTSRWRYYVAGLLAALQVAGWVFLLIVSLVGM